MIKLKKLIKETKKNIFSDKVLQKAQEAVDTGNDIRYPVRMGGLGYVKAEQILVHNEKGKKKHDYNFSHTYGVTTTRGKYYNMETYVCNICGFVIKRKN